MPVNGLEVLTVCRQHGRKEESLVAQALHDRVGYCDSVGTRVDATIETVAMEFGQYQGGLLRRGVGRAFGSGSVSMPVIAEIFPPWAFFLAL